MKHSKPKYVFDATPLIVLAKTNLLEHTLESCEAYATDQVIKETTKNKNYPDAHIIKDLIDKEALRKHSVRNTEKVKTLTRHPEIHLGEAETLTAAEELNATAVIDDRGARAVAELYGIKTHPGTLFILFRLIQTGKLDRETAETKLDQMVNAGLYLDSRTFIAAKNKLSFLSRG